MARGRKPSLSPEEQLAQITAEIEKLEYTMKELKRTKKNLTEQIRQARLAELDHIISEKGLSLEEVKALLEK